MPAEQPRPQVTLTSSSLPRATAPEPPAPSPRRRPAALLLLPLVALGLALTTGRTPAAPPPAAASFDAELLLLGERLSITQSGILVLPVELRNRGGALQVRRAEAYGSPVRDDPAVQAPQEVAAGERRRFVALIAPDCTLLDGGQSALFEASLLVRLASGSVSRDLVLDLADSELVRERVAGLCA
ncbi:MAG: hypothetical protein LH469_08515 [Frankiaceae bacterium]|nr:hypothetical protein [Frankiaceae bacterium]